MGLYTMTIKGIALSIPVITRFSVAKMSCKNRWADTPEPIGCLNPIVGYFSILAKIGYLQSFSVCFSVDFCRRHCNTHAMSCECVVCKFAKRSNE